MNHALLMRGVQPFDNLHRLEPYSRMFSGPERMVANPETIHLDGVVG